MVVFPSIPYLFKYMDPITFPHNLFFLRPFWWLSGPFPSKIQRFHTVLHLSPVSYFIFFSVFIKYVIHICFKTSTWSDLLLSLYPIFSVTKMSLMASITLFVFDPVVISLLHFSPPFLWFPGESCVSSFPSSLERNFHHGARLNVLYSLQYPRPVYLGTQPSAVDFSQVLLCTPFLLA